MAGLLKRVDAGWLARSVEDSKRADANTRNWVVKVRNNWVDSDEKKTPEEGDGHSETR
jgi:hypothetical protein